MKRKDFLSVFMFVLSVFMLPNNVIAQDNALPMESFSPEGTAKGVREVSARFSSQMVSFGDPRLPEPSEVTCPEKGRGRSLQPSGLFLYSKVVIILRTQEACIWT